MLMDLNCKPRSSIIWRSCLTATGSVCLLQAEKSLPKHRQQMESRLLVRYRLTALAATSTQVSSKFADKACEHYQANAYQALR
jgi:hypothetical protein